MSTDLNPYPGNLKHHKVDERSARANAELIQRFVDHHHKWQGRGCIEADMEWDAIIHDCHKAGFKPTKP